MKAKQSQGQPSCCQNLFAKCTFSDLIKANPPATKGIYVLRIKSRTEATPQSIVAKARQLVTPVAVA